MDPITAFFLALGILLVLTAATLACLQRPLDQILQELCGAPHRARFWTRFFDAMVLLSMLFFCLWAPPDAGTQHFSLDEIVSMLRAGLFGLLSAMAFLAFVMLVWQSRYESGFRAPAPKNGTTGVSES